MIFNTLAYYLIFLVPSAILFRVVAAKWKPWVIVVFGLCFFVYFSAATQVVKWAPLCVLLFLWEGSFSRLYKPKAFVCIVGVLISIVALGVFKYWNFVTGLITLPTGHNPLKWQDAFLPLGISFFTFEFIHYAVDRYNGKVEKGKTIEYMAFLFFFPTMIAGPIKRYQEFVPCLREPSKDWPKDWNRGITRILVGLAKKFAIADFLTTFTDHLNHRDIAVAPKWILVVWLFAYGFKIYFDFSAYSDIAIASGRLFGLTIPENFRWPYFATNIGQFWRSWHISLYRWLVDYVFIPIGGSRGSVAFVCRNTIIVMLVSGLWHGAGLNFLVWGLWHGTLLVIHRLWTTRFKPNPEGVQSRPVRAAGWALTYVSVNLGWAFFCMDLPTATYYFQRLLLR